MDRLTEPTIGCFLYQLKDHKAVPGEFGTYEAFFDYSMAVRKLGQYEETGLTPEQCGELAAASKKERHGYWFDIGGLSCRCSMCGCKNDRVRPYCPVCGAKMDGGQDAENHD